MSSLDNPHWRAVEEAEARFTEAVYAIPNSEVESLLEEALGSLASRRVALRILFGANPHLTVRVFPALEPLLLVSHAYLFHCRDLVRRLPAEVQRQFLTALTDKVITDRDADDEAYRRLAEFLDETGMAEALARLVEAARTSKDPAIKDVGSDFSTPPLVVEQCAASSEVLINGTRDGFTELLDWLGNPVGRHPCQGVDQEGVPPITAFVWRETTASGLTVEVRDGTLCFKGAEEARAWLAEMVEFLLADGREWVGMHVEHYPGHPYLSEDSVPLVLGLTSAVSR
ncbi:hypothetical protein EII34_03615 [Arachnia propionica]|uniref:Uncharacterized protein n=1 Tax=Arachnia propionica TaxID=1750 RepID=A0A3P1TCJ8_9ACTN|nr:hypothetical protein [Arachnia propionica]RRD06223.1 hypothetical protein EII34_03615 [Arachnia propionica]